jgi:phosphate transport system permease protein
MAGTGQSTLPPPEQADPIARPPTGYDAGVDRLNRAITIGFAWLVLAAVVALVVQIGQAAAPAVRSYGLEFLTTDAWDANHNRFGILPQIVGTLYSSLLGVFLGAVLGLAAAIFLTQDFLPPRLEVFLRNVVDLLAAVPSVVYGLWGIFVLIPAIRPACNWLHEHLGWIPFFGTRLLGPGLLPAALVLAVMVLPTICALSRDALRAVPHRLTEAAYGLGATRWEAILAVILPTAARGIWASIILALGRALGETMALAMLIGNARNMSWSLFAPGDTLAALLANHFAEAGQVEVGALMYAALVLLFITLVVNILGAWALQRATAGGVGGTVK